MPLEAPVWACTAISPLWGGGGAELGEGNACGRTYGALTRGEYSYTYIATSTKDVAFSV